MGAQNSVMETEIETAVNQRVEENLKATIKANSSTLCSNLQQIKDSKLKGCTITFGEQTCDAQSIMKFVGTNKLESNTKQEIIDITTQTSEQEMSGIALGQVQNSIQRMKQKASYDQLKKTNMALSTDCSQKLDLANVQNFEGTECEDSKVTYGLQSITAKTMADCAATQGAKSVTDQSLSKLMEQSSTQKLEGFSLASILLPLLLVILCPFLLPMFVKNMISGVKDSILKPPPGRKPPKPSMLTRFSQLLFVLLLLSLLAWWPGIGSWYLGVWPFGQPKSDDSPCASEGKLKKSAVTINKYYQWDPACALRPADVNPCTDDKKLFHYKCGITSGLCNTPDSSLNTGLKRYGDYLEACGMIGSDARWAPFPSCKPEDVYAVSVAKKFDGCKVCTKGKYKSGSVGKDVDCSKVESMHDVFGVDTEDDLATPCEEGEKGCMSMKEYKEKYPDDCHAAGYQNSKRRARQFLDVCKKIDEVAPDELKTSKNVSLKTQCSAGAGYFINCEGGECFYAAAGCVWKGSGPQPKKLTKSDMDNFTCGANTDEKAVRACRNDFTGCEEVDNDYKQDIQIDLAGAENCKIAYDAWKSIHMTALWITVGVYIAVVILGIVLAVMGSKIEQKQAEKDEQMGLGERFGLGGGKPKQD